MDSNCSINQYLSQQPFRQTLSHNRRIYTKHYDTNLHCLIMFMKFQIIMKLPNKTVILQLFFWLKIEQQKPIRRIYQFLALKLWSPRVNYRSVLKIKEATSWHGIRGFDIVIHTHITIVEMLLA